MTNFEFNEHTICKYTEDELIEAELMISREFEKRKENKRKKLIENFEKALKELQDNNITVCLEVSYDETEQIKFDNLIYY